MRDYNVLKAAGRPFEVVWLVVQACGHAEQTARALELRLRGRVLREVLLERVEGWPGVQAPLAPISALELGDAGLYGSDLLLLFQFDLPY